MLLFLSNSWSQILYTVDTLYPVHALDEYVQVYIDSFQTKDVDFFKSNENIHFHNFQDLEQPLLSEYTYWARINICSIDSLSDWVISIEDRWTSMPGWLTGNGKIDAYVFNKKNQIAHFKSGSDYPASAKAISQPFNINRIPLNLNSTDTLQYLFKVDGNSLGYNPSLFIRLRKSGFQDYHSISSGGNLITIIGLGVIIMAFIYHALLYFFMRQKAFGWFCLWLIAIFVTFSMAAPSGLISTYIIGEFPSLRQSLWVLSANGIWILFWFFGRSFINSRLNFPKLDKVLRFVIIGYVSFIGLYFVSLFVPDFSFLPYVNKGFLIGISLLGLIGLGLSIKILFLNSLDIKLFGLGAFIATVGPIIGRLWVFGLITLTFDPFISSAFVSVIVFSCALAYRRILADRSYQEAQTELIQAKIMKLESDKIKDLDNLKSKFFANISHELRTPLSLIKGPVSKALESIPTTELKNDFTEIPVKSKHLLMIQRNTNRLENLVDQILDLTKLENGKMQLRVRKGDIVAFIRALVSSFESLADQNHIHFQTIFPSFIEDAYFDSDKLEKIIINLLSNAFKFTQENGKISVISQHQDGLLTIQVNDSGKGMTQEQIDNVFDRFYQAEGTEQSGTGIGLALVKELVELHKGHIHVESIMGEGTHFKVKIPIQEAIYTEDEKSKDAIQTKQNYSPNVAPIKDSVNTPWTSYENDTAPLILFVEDNTDIRDFVSESLQKDYRVITEPDGDKAWETIKNRIPDVVISDIMMPGKNGLELCALIKNDMRTSHIPVLLLTAKSGQDAKNAGLQTGANDYLIKPFDNKELALRLKNLIETRDKWRQKYSKGFEEVGEETNSMEESFIKQVLESIEKNLANEFFSVEELASDVGFSRSQLNRKIKAITGKTSNQLIRDYRLERARQKLLTHTASVSEIAYQVGYANLSYFSKTFKEVYGVMPSEL